MPEFSCGCPEPRKIFVMFPMPLCSVSPTNPGSNGKPFHHVASSANNVARSSSRPASNIAVTVAIFACSRSVYSGIRTGPKICPGKGIPRRHLTDRATVRLAEMSTDRVRDREKANLRIAVRDAEQLRHLGLLVQMDLRPRAAQTT